MANDEKQNEQKNAINPLKFSFLQDHCCALINVDMSGCHPQNKCILYSRAAAECLSDHLMFYTSSRCESYQILD